MSNREEPVYAMLATTSIGAIWLGSLPLMGPQVRKTLDYENIKKVDKLLGTDQKLKISIN